MGWFSRCFFCRPRRWRVFVACLLVGLPAGAQGGARELYWRELGVEARLDAEGRLHVSERHQMVFSGDWNGGERRFRVPEGQELELEGITRLEADGSEQRLAPGPLSSVDRYAWAEGRTLRWRSRSESDPPFEHSELGYRIDYVLSHVLDGSGTSFELDHDFAFGDRPGNIELFQLQLTLDPVWSSQPPSPIVLERGPLAPGQGAVVKLALEHGGAGLAGRPGFWRRALAAAPPDWPLRLSLSLLLLASVAAALRLLFARAQRRGFFEPVPAQSEIDAAWLQRHVLCLPPELVGAAYDRHTGSAEVMALIARLELEGKLTTALKDLGAGKQDLELELRVARDRFVGHERELVDALFVSGDRTSTTLIRSHYRRFDPAQRLERALTPRLRALLGGHDPAQSGRTLLPWIWGALAAWALNSALVEPARVWFGIGSGSVLFILSLVLLAGFLGFGVFAAAGFRNDPEPRESQRSLVRWCSVASLLVVLLLLIAPEASSLGALFHFAGGLAFVGLVLWKAAQIGDAPGILLRKRLYAARAYFQKQLARESPDLEDAWSPYLIALGLAPEVGGWFRAFAEPEAQRAPRPSGASSSSNSSSASSLGPSDGPRWTGGGGRFGGAGASGSWVSAAEELAAGVAPAVSSGSSGSYGSSSSGSSRSGGGGGGGW